MKTKILCDAKYAKPGIAIGEIIKDGKVYDKNWCENEFVVEIDGKLYEGMRVLMLREKR